MDSRNSIVNLNLKLEEESNVLPKQSANTLFNFMKERKFLEKILANQAIIPRYVEEDLRDLLQYSDIPSLSFPMTCFCDINLSKIEGHVERYGRYGIAFHKKWGVEKGIQPVQYISKKSILRRDLESAFLKARIEQNSDERSNYLLTHIAFMKPMIFFDEEDQNKSYYLMDEREWRYIPNITESDSELPPFLKGKDNNKTSRENHNSGMEECKEAWLKFQWQDIKYIIVPNRLERKKIISYLRCNICKCNIDDAYELISKILILDELQEDI